MIEIIIPDRCQAGFEKHDTANIYPDKRSAVHLCFDVAVRCFSETLRQLLKFANLVQCGVELVCGTNAGRTSASRRTT